MYGTEMSFDDFIKEYKDINNNGGSVEVIDITTDEVIELSESEFNNIIQEEKEI